MGSPFAGTQLSRCSFAGRGGGIGSAQPEKAEYDNHNQRYHTNVDSRARMDVMKERLVALHNLTVPLNPVTLHHAFDSDKRLPPLVDLSTRSLFLSIAGPG